MTRRRKGVATAAGLGLVLLAAGLLGVKLGTCPVEKTQALVAAPHDAETMLSQVVAEPSTEPMVALPAPSDTSPSLVAWHPVGNWAGYGSSETERFITGGSEWRITWRTNGEPRRVCALGIYVYDGSGAFVTLAALRQGVGSDISYVRAEPGEYYLSVISCAADWEIAVEDCY